MTAPDGQQTPPEQDGQSLIPALLAVYAAYMTYRAAAGRLTGSIADISRVLGLEARVGSALLQIASRALTRQRDAAGRAAEELFLYERLGLARGVQAGVKTIVEALRWLDRHSDEGGGVTRDAAGQGGSWVPTSEDPPDVLADVIAQATASAAQEAAAKAAGWRHKRWETVGDDRVRDTHQALAGRVVGVRELFVSPSGARLRYPGDPDAPIAEWAGCRCWVRMVR